MPAMSAALSSCTAERGCWPHLYVRSLQRYCTVAKYASHCECYALTMRDHALISGAPQAQKSTYIGILNVELQRPPERQQVTVLLCDLMDSSGLIERLDPEETPALMLDY